MPTEIKINLFSLDREIVLLNALENKLCVSNPKNCLTRSKGLTRSEVVDYVNSLEKLEKELKRAVNLTKKSLISAKKEFVQGDLVSAENIKEID